MGRCACFQMTSGVIGAGQVALDRCECCQFSSCLCIDVGRRTRNLRTTRIHRAESGIRASNTGNCSKADGLGDGIEKGYLELGRLGRIHRDQRIQQDAEDDVAKTWTRQQSNERTTRTAVKERLVNSGNPSSWRPLSRTRTRPSEQ